MLPLHLTQHPALRSPLWLGGLSAIAVGTFLGAWVIGPALSSGSTEYAKLRSAKEERAAFELAIASPDPSPYRYPTPEFDTPNAPAYGKLAKMKAQAGAASARASDEEFRASDHPQVSDAFGGIGWQSRDNAYRQAPAHSSYRARDRHAVY